MRFDVFLQKTSNLVGENRILKFFVVVIGVSVITNSFFMYKAMRQQRTIILPVGMGVATGQIEVQDEVLSDAYLRLMTRYVMTLFMNYTPDRIHNQYSELLELFSSAAYPEYKERFTTLADDIKETKVTGFFSVQSIVSQSAGQGQGEIDVIGIKKQFLESSLVTNEVVHYRISYEVVNGMFQLVEISEISSKV